jgi:hypothetical protein
VMMYFFTWFLVVRRCGQWQAQEPPQAAGAALALDSPLLLAAVSPAVAAAAPVAAVLVAAAPPPLKSVAYQPEPLSWKPAAVSCLPKLSAPQAGQVVSGASDSFCSTSLA